MLNSPMVCSGLGSDLAVGETLAGPRSTSLSLGEHFRASVSTSLWICIVFPFIAQPGLVVGLLPPEFWRGAIDFPFCPRQLCIH